MNFRQSIIGSSIAFFLATSCCWLPSLIITIGGASSLMAFANGLERFSGVFIAIGTISLIYGGYQLYNKRKSIMQSNEIQLQSTITCPECGHQKEEQMPTEACQFFYACENCKKVLKPIQGDCCVYCSYGTVACPPIQQNQDCC